MCWCVDCMALNSFCSDMMGENKAEESEKEAEPEKKTIQTEKEQPAKGKKAKKDD